MKYYIGINVGGTKCSISLGRDDNGKLSILKSETFPTIPNAPDTMIEKFQQRVHGGMRDVVFAEAQLDEPGIVGAAMLPISNGC